MPPWIDINDFKVFHVKYKTKIIPYSDFNHFDNTSTYSGVIFVHPEEFEKFKYISLKVLNIYATVNEKHASCNQSPFMNKQLRKAIMTRTPLLDEYKKKNSAGNLFAYKRQRIFANYQILLTTISKMGE